MRKRTPVRSGPTQWLTTFDGNYQCRDLGKVVEASPNCWRATDPVRVIARMGLRHVLLLQHTRLMQDAWDMHLGDRVKSKGAVSDCLHTCYTPNSFEPVWWAVRALAESPHLGVVPNGAPHGRR